MGDIAYAMHRMVYWCRDANLGYGQDTRNRIWSGGAADCSSLVIKCLNEAGFDTGNAWYTGNMLPELLAKGWESVGFDDIQPGDVLLTPNDHVAMVIQDGEHIGEAYINEIGGIVGGRDGDQTGFETRLDRHWTARPWAYCLRAGASIRGGGSANSTTDDEEIDMSVANAILDSLATDWFKPMWKEITAIRADLKDHKEAWLKHIWEKDVEINTTVKRIDGRIATIEDVLYNGSRLKDKVWRPGLLHLAIENQKRINGALEEIAELKAIVNEMKGA